MGNKSKKDSMGKRDMFKWTERMDDVFINTLLQQQKLGNQADNIFTSTAYDNMLKELRERLGMPFEKDHLKNRLKTLKNHFKECFDIFNGVNVFSWSPETKMWSARPEVWKALVKVKNDGGKVASGRASRFAQLFEPDDLINEITLNLDDLNETNDGTSHLGTPVEENSHADSEDHSKSAISSRGQKRKPSGGETFEREFKGIRDAIRDVAEAIREGNLIAERGRPRVYSEEEVFAELVKIGFDSLSRYKAYSFLIADGGRVRAFFGCPFEERKDYLPHMMYGP